MLVFLNPVMAAKKKKKTVKNTYEDFISVLDAEFGPNNLVWPFCFFQPYLMSAEPVDKIVSKFYKKSVVNKIVEGVTGDSEPFMKLFSGALKSIAIFFVFIQVIVSTLKEVSRAELTLESALRIMIALCLPIVLILEYDTILKGVTGVGLQFHEMLRKNITLDLTSLKGTKVSTGLYGIENESLFTKVISTIAHLYQNTIGYWSAFLRSLMVFLIALIVNLAIIITILSGIMSNYVEIGLRHIFMPIAIAFVAHDGMRSSGMRYIKRYLGCFIKIGAITAAVEIAFFIYGKILISKPNILEQWIFLLLLFPLVKQAIKMCNEVVTEALGD